MATVWSLSLHSLDSMATNLICEGPGVSFQLWGRQKLADTQIWQSDQLQ